MLRQRNPSKTNNLSDFAEESCTVQSFWRTQESNVPSDDSGLQFQPEDIWHKQESVLKQHKALRETAEISGRTCDSLMCEALEQFIGCNEVALLEQAAKRSGKAQPLLSRPPIRVTFVTYLSLFRWTSTTSRLKVLRQKLGVRNLESVTHDLG